MERGESKINVKSKKAKTDLQVMPNDLVHEIIVRLPVKSLVRFKCVSKWWYREISSPKFIEKQHKNGSEKSMMLLVMSGWRLQDNLRWLQDEYALSFHGLDSLELEEVRQKLPIYSFLNIPKSPKFVHCLGGKWSKGIICITYNNSIRLCNPTLRESKILPPRPSIDRRSTYDDGLLARGFGISSTGEFKVILVREFFIIRKRTWTFPAHLYTSTTNSWKRIGDAPHKPYNIPDDGHVLFFNGACHWFASHIILSFNMTTEVFGELELPYDLTSVRGRHTYPIVIHDCFAVVIKDRWLQSGVLEVWVMKTYAMKESWTKQFVIQLPLDIAHELDITPFSSWKNDEWLLSVNRNTQRLTCISFLTNEIRSYQISVGYYTSPLVYKESLVALN